MKRKVAVILTGAGHKDGTEITEAVSVLIALSEMGADYECFAPNLTNSQGMNALEMSQRIARGAARALEELDSSQYDALVFPGGMGAASILSDFAEKGREAAPLPIVKQIVEAFHKSAKPIGFICIALNLAGLILGKEGVELTVGAEGDVARTLQSMGATHTVCPTTDYISDRDHKTLSTPAYMDDSATPYEVFTGIRKMLIELVEMA